MIVAVMTFSCVCFGVTSKVHNLYTHVNRQAIFIFHPAIRRGYNLQLDAVVFSDRRKNPPVFRGIEEEREKVCPRYDNGSIRHRSQKVKNNLRSGYFSQVAVIFCVK